MSAESRKNIPRMTNATRPPPHAPRRLRPPHVSLRTLALALSLPLVAWALTSCSPDAPTGASPAEGAYPLPDVATTAGLDFVHRHGGRGRKFLFETMGSGVAVADFDGDERPDILLLQSGTLPVPEFGAAGTKAVRVEQPHTARLYSNEGDMQFRDITGGSGLERAFYAMGLAVGDMDSDGDRDLFIAAFGKDHLYENDGAAHFRSVGEERGLDDPRWNVSGAFVDVDSDGDLDLYTVSYLDMPLSSHRFCGPRPGQRTYCHVDYWPGLPDRLWINDGSGHFSDGTSAAGLAGNVGKGLSVLSGDYDDDGDPDLFVANDSEANFLLRNDGHGVFEEVGRHSGTDLNAEGRSEASMGSDIGDLDGDGDLDMFVVNFENETNTLYRNDGRGFFTDVSMTSGAGAPSLPMLGFGTAFLDLENDGDLDIYVANGHIMVSVFEIQGSGSYEQADQILLNDGAGRFTPAPPETAPSQTHPRVGRGVATGDLDGDGDLDLVVTNSNAAPFLLRNDMARGHRLVLELLGPDGRADAEGARVTIQAGGRTIVREIRSGGSYLSHSDTRLVIGLGQATTLDQLSIRWPGRAMSEHAGLAMDQVHRLAAGGELISSRPLPAQTPLESPR
jgi:hypothetical protein